MVSPESITPEAHFDAMSASYRRLAEEVDFAIKDAVQAEGIKTHTITPRVKKRDSYLEKVIRKAYNDPINQVEDIVGLRIVCLFTSDLPRLKVLIHNVFDVVSEEDKVEGGPKDSFGYMSVHYICKLRANNSGPRYRGLQDIKFEIQCRTILMDAWANVSHYLAYKGEASIPEQLRKDFHALAGLFYVADKHFELFFEEAEGSQAQAAVAVANHNRPMVVPVNRDTVHAVLASKYPGRRATDLESVSDFTQMLADAGYTTIEQVEADLDKGKIAALTFEKDNPPFGKAGEIYAPVGLARQALSIVNPIFGAISYGIKQNEDRFEAYRKLV